jgi:hypothetical protein
VPPMPGLCNRKSKNLGVEKNSADPWERLRDRRTTLLFVWLAMSYCILWVTDCILHSGLSVDWSLREMESTYLYPVELPKIRMVRSEKACEACLAEILHG